MTKGTSPGPDDGDRASARGDEPRVRDLLERGDDAAAPPDLETLARLAAWFELPSVDQLVAAGVAAEPPSRAAEIQRRRAQALADVDPRLVARMEAHGAVAARLGRPAQDATPWERRARAMTSLDQDAIPPLPTEDDWREVEVPQALRKDLATCTPQASLRDLHRPEKEFFVHLESPFEDLGEEEAAPDPMAPVRATIRRDYREGTTLPSAAAAMAASWSGLRGLLEAPWAEAKRERARQREAELLAREAEAAAGKDPGATPVPRVPGEAP